MFKKIISTIVGFGIVEDMPFTQAKRVKLVNVCSFLAALSTFPYIFLFIGQITYLGIASLTFFLAFIGTLLWNCAGKYQVAKFWILVNSHAYILLTASSFGRYAGEQLILIPVLFGAVLVFEFKEKLSLYFSIGLTVACFLFLEYTNYSLLNLDISPAEQLEYYQGNLVITVACCVTIAIFYFYLYGQQLDENQRAMNTSKEIEEMISYFSNSLYGKNTVDEILWDVAKNCIGRLGLVDCVIYMMDEDRQVLVQKAAFGDKNPHDFEIFNPIVIPAGKGIVGHVAKTMKPFIVQDTSKEPMYIADDRVRLSEVAVPLIYNNKTIGVIDSEHPEKNFYKQRHVDLLNIVASLCANKVVRAMADEERAKALKIKMEAEKIKAFDEFKTKLFANVSHELRTPLTLIKGTVSKHREESEDWILMHRHTDHLLRLINQILDLTKIESGHFELHHQPNDITAFFKILVSTFSSLASHKQVEIIDNIGDDPFYLSYDQDALEKIMFNLFSNAIKFSPHHSSIELKVTYDDVLVIQVIDRGPGIPDLLQNKIFERYYQVPSVTSGGTGIGLALTKELVELFNGDISVSNASDGGAVFTVKLPVPISGASENEVQMEVEDSLSEVDSKRLVLLVEDNVELLAYIRNELKESFKVITAADGELAKKKAQDQLPDVIISDIMMPNTDGIEFCKWLKNNELTSHIPIMLLTAVADQKKRLEGYEQGADDYLTKPFDSHELRVRVNNLLRSRDKLKEKYQNVLKMPSHDIVIQSSDELFMKKVLKAIDNNIENNDYSVSQLCEEVGLSRMQMHRKLVALTDFSATSFIREVRLHRAMELLSSGEPVSQVAYAVGFNSLSYFSKIFKGKFGHLPSEVVAVNR
ncbi:ATP-binding protein [Fulvivirga ligni]|uniref:ATP-binding protein n=1 Tax=Fulvivirga ligni TaxID=2904246 RepID=UPI001F1A0830|nr:ATP-binding protein [Fulvivirga ligni]UII23513.1 response regulator [Fulvivirga ligni]